MKTIINILLVLFIFSFVGCTKYEDGPAFTLLTKKARITNTWKMEKYIYDDGSSTTNVDGGTMTLNKDMSATLSTSETNGISISGTWSFIDNKKGLRISYNVLGMAGNKDYTILKLKSKELWVHDADQKVEIHLVPA